MAFTLQIVHNSLGTENKADGQDDIFTLMDTSCLILLQFSCGIYKLPLHLEFEQCSNLLFIFTRFWQKIDIYFNGKLHGNHSNRN